MPTLLGFCGRAALTTLITGAGCRSSPTSSLRTPPADAFGVAPSPPACSGWPLAVPIRVPQIAAAHDEGDHGGG